MILIFIVIIVLEFRFVVSEVAASITATKLSATQGPGNRTNVRGERYEKTNTWPTPHLHADDVGMLSAIPG